MSWFDDVMMTPGVERVFESIKSHRKPIAMLGAGRDAKLQTEILRQHNIEVEVYYVERDYFKPDMSFQSRKVLCFDDLSKAEAEKYVFVLGICVQEYEGVAARFFAKADIIKYALPTLEVFGIPEPIEHTFIKNNFDKFDETYHMLDDDFSRKTFTRYLQGKVSADYQYNEEVCCDDKQYFIDLMHHYKGGVFFDCGAYNGDTVTDFIAWSNGIYQKIYAVEAEEKNFTALSQLVNDNDYNNVELINKGVWDKEDSLFLASGMGRESPSINEQGAQKVLLDTIDNIVGNEDITFIKMDIEGSELHALHGAKKTIERCMPALAICVYHKKDDLITIPQFIKTYESKNLKYKLYLRKYFKLSTAGDLVLYAVPSEKA